ncbi:MAG: hypothetical protein WCV90_08500 [Candidatus Woesearchaeota archaeon]
MKESIPEKVKRLKENLNLAESAGLIPLTIHTYASLGSFVKATALETYFEGYLNALPEWFKRETDPYESFVVRLSRVMEAYWGFLVVEEPYPIGIWYLAEKEDQTFYRRVNGEIKGLNGKSLYQVLIEKFPETFNGIYGETLDGEKAYSQNWDEKHLVIFRYGLDERTF